MSNTHCPFIIGLTGNIATGKSTILRYLASKGAYVIDADKLAHRTMAPDGLAYAAIMKAFGQEILDASGVIDRSALGRIVFNDPAALQRLEQIVHPAVFQLAQQEIAQTHAPVVVIEAIKLLEARSLSKLCNEVWVVTASPETQLRRLRKERGMDEAEAHKRMAAQSPEAEKLKQADRVIHNDGSVEQLHLQLDGIWTEIEKRWTDSNDFGTNIPHFQTG
jgi:dephospho-CoA kinase